MLDIILMKSKKKIKVCLEGSTETVGIGWYGDVNKVEIENSIRKAFNLPKDNAIFLKDGEGDIIVITDSIPLTEVYKVSPPRS